MINGKFYLFKWNTYYFVILNKWMETQVNYSWPAYAQLEWGLELYWGMGLNPRSQIYQTLKDEHQDSSSFNCEQGGSGNSINLLGDAYFSTIKSCG